MLDLQHTQKLCFTNANKKESLNSLDSNATDKFILRNKWLNNRLLLFLMLIPESCKADDPIPGYDTKYPNKKAISPLHKQTHSPSLSWLLSPSADVESWSVTQWDNLLDPGSQTIICSVHI